MSKLLWLTFKTFIKPPTVHNKQLKLASSVITILTLLQSWPRESSKSSQIGELLQYIAVFTYCNLTSLALVGHIYRLCIILNVLIIVRPLMKKILLIDSTTGLNYNEVAINLAYLSIAFSGYQYCFHLFRHRQLCKKLLEELGDYRHFDKPNAIEVVDAVLNVFHKLVNCIGMSLIPIALVYLLSTTCEVEDYDCGLAYPAYVPGLMTSYRRKILLVLQLTTTGTYNLLGVAVVCIGMQLTEYLVQYLKQCQIMTKKLTTAEDCNTRKYLTRRLVRYHQRILYLYTDYQSVVRGIFVVHAISTPAIIAMMLYSLMVNFQAQILFTFFTLMSSFFGICFMGQRLINESDELAKVVYDSIPLDGDVYTAKMLLFVLQQTQHPLTAPVGSLTFCGHELFAQVLKASYSFLAIIQST